MSAIDAFAGNSTPTNSADAFATLTSGEFLKIIFTELQNQDPLAPNDTSAMLDQLATLRSIESDTQMVNSLQRMVDQVSTVFVPVVLGIALVTLLGWRCFCFCFRSSACWVGICLNRYCYRVSGCLGSSSWEGLESFFCNLGARVLGYWTEALSLLLTSGFGLRFF